VIAGWFNLNWFLVIGHSVALGTQSHWALSRIGHSVVGHSVAWALSRSIGYNKWLLCYLILFNNSSLLIVSKCWSIIYEDIYLQDEYKRRTNHMNLGCHNVGYACNIEWVYKGSLGGGDMDFKNRTNWISKYYVLIIISTFIPPEVQITWNPHISQ
jgi:hypothetical protein